MSLMGAPGAIKAAWSLALRAVAAELVCRATWGYLIMFQSTNYPQSDPAEYAGLLMDFGTQC